MIEIKNIQICKKCGHNKDMHSENGCFVICGAGMCDCEMNYND